MKVLGIDAQVFQHLCDVRHERPRSAQVKIGVRQIRHELLYELGVDSALEIISTIVDYSRS